MYPPRLTHEQYDEDEDLDEWTDRVTGEVVDYSCRFCPGRGESPESVDHVNPCPVLRDSPESGDHD